ncbi:MAG: ABC transporter permease [Treponema sp. GWB1_62_6]|nr:MAG: ABC transporter permease [Treponema sp. GWA1_62_8]OHE63049.1 MAG: ABC transporter permease [Treponema sp. GWC1_61_84]OHE65671.1 MAG: ABC transporter permease [Treponema sp. GWB1_62_6]OHE74725.1 MAG: ABC transporter permease [Treponema sp. RIFOXYC1_FULL_61_9]HCM26883.1 ABC transporter permease [Treponema sp.]
MTLANKRAVTAYSFLVVPLIFFIGVRFGPMLYMMGMSLTDWGLLRKTLQFIGPANFEKIFADPVFVQSLKNTARYSLFGAPTVIALSLGLALMLNVIPKGKGVFRLIYVLPYITPVVAVSWVWRWMFQTPPLGVINAVLGAAGLPAMEFLNSTTQALPTILAVNVWVELGYCTTVFLAGIQTIPDEIVEAARIDGAASAQVLRKIVLPLLLPVTLFLTIIEGIQFLRIFTQVYNMSFQAMGGPLESTKSVALYIYQKAFTNFEMGIAASASLVLFGIIMAVTLLQMKFFDRKLDY